jgi:hypothetical protein
MGINAPIPMDLATEISTQTTSSVRGVLYAANDLLMSKIQPTKEAVLALLHFHAAMGSMRYR